jgi:predicted RNase H-like nuclease (RuvC/YqgF family)
VWADKRPEKKWIREEIVEDTAESWRHRALCLEAEVSARSAACDVKQQEIDILEEGLREARKQIDELKRKLEFRRTTKTAASRPDAE